MAEPYRLIREFHTRRDWVQLRENPSGGWTLFIGDNIGGGLWQWIATYADNLAPALSIYEEEAANARQYLHSRGYCSLEEVLVADALKRKKDR